MSSQLVATPKLRSFLSSMAELIQQRIDSKRFDGVAETFQHCFVNTLETTIQTTADGTTFVITGDIPAMWLRDSTAQVQHYIPLLAEDEQLRGIVRGMIYQHAAFIAHDPYANAFNREANGAGHQTDHTRMTPEVWERKYELDSLCYPVRLLHAYYTATYDESVFTSAVHKMLSLIVDTMLVEQNHDERSEYTFKRDNVAPSDTLAFDGRGTRTNYTGMVWSGFRPSDDSCRFHYLIPANLFAATILNHVRDYAARFYNDEVLSKRAEKLRREILFGVQTYGIVQHPKYGAMYAYETDGYGNYNLMDDANVPSLLSLPYLGACATDDPLYRNTRAFVLSDDNPYYQRGTYASGVGSPHTPEGYIWHIGLIMQALTATNNAERESLLEMILRTTAGTPYMHESFDPDDPKKFTRPWFAWANSLYAELICRMVMPEKYR
jgi:uncharacterized protein